MSFNLLTNENLSTLNPSDIISYLKSKGWKLIQPTGTNYSGVTYVKEIENKEFDVFIPKTPTFADYLKRIKELLLELEKVECRTVEKIFYDMKHTPFDVIRFRVIHPLCSSGELPLDGSLKLIDGAREIIATAVLSLTERKAYFPRRNNTANDYLKKVHVAQSEVGSYILKITIPIPPAQTLPLTLNEDPNNISDPFERNVTKHLMSSLNSCLSASEEAVLLGAINPLTNKFDQGVNANLLLAISKMGEIFESNDIEISTTWSGNRPSPDNIPSRTFIGKDHIQFIKEAARILKDTTPIEDFELVGHVTKLEGNQGAQDEGRATISGIIDGVMKNVRMKLSPNDHVVAHFAYGEKKAVRCFGELKKDNRTYSLESPRNFTIIVDPETTGV